VVRQKARPAGQIRGISYCPKENSQGSSLKTFGIKLVDFDTVDTPVGEKCIYCEEVIESDDRGFVMSLLAEDTTSPSNFMKDTTCVYHYECNLRLIIGSLGHQKEECSCFGGIGTGDSEGMSKREAARQAYKRYMLYGFKHSPGTDGPDEHK
jgi:hypothetical protein